MVTVVDVEDAQHAWGEGIVAIATAHSTVAIMLKLPRYVGVLYAYIDPQFVQTNFGCNRAIPSDI